MLGHPEAAHLVGAEDLGHLLVGDEVLLVVGILKSESRKRSVPDLLRPSGIKSRANRGLRHKIGQNRRNPGAI